MLCPVAAVLAYLVMRPSSPGPLFIFEDGQPFVLHASGCSHWAGLGIGRGGLCLDLVATVLRIGAATTAAHVGHSGLIDSNTGMLEVLCLFIIHPDTITLADFSISMFVILTLRQCTRFLCTCYCEYFVSVAILYLFLYFWVCALVGLCKPVVQCMEPNTFLPEGKRTQFWSVGVGIGTYNTWNLILSSL